MVNIPYCAFFADSSNFPDIREMLKLEFGLTEAINDPGNRTEDELLVYCPDGLKCYRVNFNSEHIDGPVILFRYWDRHMDQKYHEEDPMRLALKMVYEILKPDVRVTDIFQEPIPDLERLLE